MTDPTELSIEKLREALQDRILEVERVREQLAIARRELSKEITERKKTEKLSRNLLDNSPSLICTHDLKGVLTSVNSVTTNLIGLSAHDLIGRSLTELLSPSVRHLFGEYLNRIQKCSRDAGLIRIVGRNGEDRLLIYQNVLIAEKDSEPYVLGNAQDITDLSRTQRALRASEERYRMLFENNPYPMWVYDIDSYLIRAVNEAAIQNYGYKRSEFLRLTIFDICPTEDAERLIQHLANLGDRPTNVEVPWKHKKKDGTIIDVDVRALPITFEGRKARLVLASDVTERKKAEKALRDSEERFQLVARATNDVIWDWNVPEDVVWVSDAFTTVFGYNREEIRKSDFWLSMLHSDDKDRILNAFSKLIEERQQFWSGEYRLRRNDGSYAFILDRSFMTLDVSGKPLRMIGSMTDISERKLAEERLTKQNEYFAALHDTAINLMSRLNLNEVLEAIVTRMCALTKIEHGYLYLLDPVTNRMMLRVGIGCAREYIGYEAKLGIGIAGQVWKTGQSVIVEDYASWTYRLPDLNLSLKSVIGVPLKSGPKIVGVLGLETTDKPYAFSKEEIEFLTAFAELASLAFDNARLYTASQKELTERIQAQDALGKSEEKFRLLFEESKDVFFISSIDGRFTDINPTGVELFGYSSKEEMLAIKIDSELFHDPDIRRIYQNLMKEQGFVKDFELQLRRKDGEILTMMETATAVYDPQGNVVAYRGIMRDMTQLKSLQHQILQWQKIETIGQLAGGIAHDFNNLLMAISAHCEVLELKIPSLDPLLNDLSEIKKAVDAGASLTRQLLAFSRKQVLEPKRVNLNSVLSGMGNMLRRLIGEHIRLEFDFDSKLGTVEVDPTQFEQVILNLSVNAKDAMPEGGQLFIQTGSIQYKNGSGDPVHAGVSGDFAIVTVKDSGSGMDSEILSHIFEPFFTTKQEGGGTGLGLPTVYGIVKQSGGHVVVDSQIGVGTIFKLYFPIKDTPQKEEHPVSLLTDFQSRAGNILLVDDNESILQAVGCFLDMEGYQVTRANSPVLALQLSEKIEPIDLLITDVVMPHMTGPQLAEAIRNKNHRIKVLFMSGYSDEAVLKPGVLNQNSVFLQKPASMKDLVKKINLLLG